MRIENVSGEYAFRALYKLKSSKSDIKFEMWHLSDAYFFSLEEVKLTWPDNETRWPVEVNENGSIYVPSKEELDEEPNP